jgi:hypothetical protein
MLTQVLLDVLLLWNVSGRASKAPFHHHIDTVKLERNSKCTDLAIPTFKRSRTSITWRSMLCGRSPTPPSAFKHHDYRVLDRPSSPSKSSPCTSFKDQSRVQGVRSEGEVSAYFPSGLRSTLVHFPGVSSSVIEPNPRGWQLIFSGYNMSKGKHDIYQRRQTESRKKSEERGRKEGRTYINRLGSPLLNRENLMPQLDVSRPFRILLTPLPPGRGVHLFVREPDHVGRGFEVEHRHDRVLRTSVDR